MPQGRAGTAEGPQLSSNPQNYKTSNRSPDQARVADQVAGRVPAAGAVAVANLEVLQEVQPEVRVAVGIVDSSQPRPGE